MDTIFIISLVLICAGSMCVTYNCLVGWLQRIEGKLDKTIIRSSALRLDQYMQARNKAAQQGNEEMMELIDNLIDNEFDLGLEDDKTYRLKKKIMESPNNKKH